MRVQSHTNSHRVSLAAEQSPEGPVRWLMSGKEGKKREDEAEVLMEPR